MPGAEEFNGVSALGTQFHLRVEIERISRGTDRGVCSAAAFIVLSPAALPAPQVFLFPSSA